VHPHASDGHCDAGTCSSSGSFASYSLKSEAPCSGQRNEERSPPGSESRYRNDKPGWSLELEASGLLLLKLKRFFCFCCSDTAPAGSDQKAKPAGVVALQDQNSKRESDDRVP
jgi:hypothetical protein